MCSGKSITCVYYSNFIYVTPMCIPYYCIALFIQRLMMCCIYIYIIILWYNIVQVRLSCPYPYPYPWPSIHIHNHIHIYDAQSTSVCCDEMCIDGCSWSYFLQPRIRTYNITLTPLVRPYETSVRRVLVLTTINGV